MNHYVYRIDRPTTGEWYVGIRSSKCWPTRDTSYMGSGTRVCRIERSQLRKTILCVVQTRDEAARIEAALVDLTNSLCLNLVEGGDKGVLGMVHSPGSRKRISKGLMGNKNSSGTVWTPEMRAKISLLHKGKPKSPEHNRKNSAAKKKYYTRLKNDR